MKVGPTATPHLICKCVTVRSLYVRIFGTLSFPVDWRVAPALSAGKRYGARQHSSPFNRHTHQLSSFFTRQFASSPVAAGINSRASAQHAAPRTLRPSINTHRSRHCNVRLRTLSHDALFILLTLTLGGFPPPPFPSPLSFISSLPSPRCRSVPSLSRPPSLPFATLRTHQSCLFSCFLCFTDSLCGFVFFE